MKTLVGALAIVATLLIVAPGANAIDTCAYTPGAPTVGFPGGPMPLPCGPNGLLQVASSVKMQAAPPTSATAYGAGNVIGGLISFTNATRYAGLGAVLQNISVTFTDGVVPSLDVILFDANPSASTITDNAPVSVVAADVPKIIGVIHITDCTLVGTSAPSVCQAANQAILYTLPTGQTLYAVVVARSAVTLTNTSDMTITAQALEN